MTQQTNQTESPRYATLLYDVRKALGISIPEYFYMDMVYFLSRRTGWCFKSLEAIAEDMGMQKSGVSYMRDRLVKKGFLERNKKGEVRATDKYEEIAIINRGGVQKVNGQTANRSLSEPQRSLSEPQRSLSGTKNNKRITIRNSAPKNYSKNSEDKRGQYSETSSILGQLIKKHGVREGTKRFKALKQGEIVETHDDATLSSNTVANRSELVTDTNVHDSFLRLTSSDPSTAQFLMRGNLVVDG